MGAFGQSGDFAAKLHSRYPQAEAERYIDALNLKPDTGCFILIEPGLGYLAEALQKRLPLCKIVVLHADNCFREMHLQGKPCIPVWFPDRDSAGIDSTSVQEFLEAHIDESLSVHIIEWRPSLQVFGTKCLELVRESVDFIKRIEASRRTSAAFGRRWVRNFFRNLAFIRKAVLYRTMDMPIVITGSGPSLESALPKIRAARDGNFILAVSSSLPALAANGITPDMAISTDGGNWARLHLQMRNEELGMKNWDNSLQSTLIDNPHRLQSNIPTPDSRLPTPDSRLPTPPLLAFSLTAALPSQCSVMPLLPLNDGCLWQNMALHSAGIPSIMLPQRGTVTASALDLAMALSSGDIYFSGMDLSVRGLNSHARPYGFDHLFFGTASRFRPVYSQCFTRSSEINAGGSHDVYAAWFKNKIAAWLSQPKQRRRFFSLGGNHAVLEDNLPQGVLRGGEGDSRGYFTAVSVNGDADKRGERAVTALAAALGDKLYAGTLNTELAPLLFPSRDGVQADEIAAEIVNITRKRG